jgi:hypothetical protein
MNSCATYGGDAYLEEAVVNLPGVWLSEVLHLGCDTVVGLFVHSGEGTTRLQNIWYKSPRNTALYPRRLELLTV